MHTHDLDLEVRRTNVIYLYRDPVDTIYSQMNYHKEPLDNVARITYWTELYGNHLRKWLCDETFTEKKTILSYDKLRENLPKEFEKLLNHFDLQIDHSRLDQVAAKVTKNEVIDLTKHDPQVVQTRNEYKIHRNTFRESKGKIIWEILLAQWKDLMNFFPNKHTTD